MDQTVLSAQKTTSLLLRPGAGRSLVATGFEGHTQGNPKPRIRGPTLRNLGKPSQAIPSHPKPSQAIPSHPKPCPSHAQPKPSQTMPNHPSPRHHYPPPPPRRLSCFGEILTAPVGVMTPSSCSTPGQFGTEAAGSFWGCTILGGTVLGSLLEKKPTIWRSRIKGVPYFRKPTASRCFGLGVWGSVKPRSSGLRAALKTVPVTGLRTQFLPCYGILEGRVNVGSSYTYKGFVMWVIATLIEWVF